MKARKLFKEFHGRKSDDDFTIDIEDVSEMFLIGEAVAIEYRAKKHDDKQYYTYRHKFKKGDLVLANNTVLLITGRNLKIKAEGIIN